MAKKNNKSRKIATPVRLLIKNYGLFWKVEDVFWGKPKKPGGLYGIKHGAKRSNYVDFRFQTGIYVLYADYKIVYIGQAGYGNSKLFERLKLHRKDDLSGRWNQFSWFGLRSVLQTNQLKKEKDSEHPSTNIILNHIEAILIHACEPPLNRQGGKWSKTVHKFLQHRDEDNLGLTETEMLNEIHKQGQNVKKILTEKSKKRGRPRKKN